MSAERLNIIVVDDHPIVIEGLRKVLENEYNQLNMICFTTGQDVLNYAKTEVSGVDIVLLDITLPDISGITICSEIKALKPEWCVLAFSNHSDRGTIVKMLQHGASGYILKNASSQEMIYCIDEALQGRVALSNQARETMGRPGPGDLKAPPMITRREKEILQLIATGKTSLEIAVELHLSPLTVETHRRNLMQKFEAKNSVALIKMATGFDFI